MGQLYSVFKTLLWALVRKALVRPYVVKRQTWVCSGPEDGQPHSFSKIQGWVLEPLEGKRLCSVCLSLGQLPFEHWNSINNFRDTVIQHHHTVETLLASALRGCHFCNLLVIAWEQNCVLSQDSDGHWFGKLGFDSAALDGWIKLRFRREKKSLPYTGVQVDEVQISILCGNMPHEMGGQLICYPANAGFQALPKTCLPSISDSNTGSRASISRMQTWLETCISSHPKCNQKEAHPPPLPTRVIAVGGKRSRICHLVPGTNKRGNYATLSHCWGSSNNQPLKTTDRTLSLRKQGMKDEKLPKTFRDAVQLCRELGIKYLWIDSLCVIQDQDSQEDWAKEAPKMGDIYGNSVLTISAAASADSTEGCFRNRLGLIVWPCPILLFGQQFHVSRYPTDEERGGNPGDLQLAPSHPLNDRGWVLQEQVLSRRSLIFTPNRLVWRCASMSTNEKYPLGIPHTPNLSMDNYRLLHCLINNVIEAEQSNSDIDIYTSWYRMVEVFTSRKMTYQDDRLPAIAGVAQKFAAIANDNYYAGLWRGDLLAGMLWVSTMLTLTKTNRTARAPSWSWASVDCTVGFTTLNGAGYDTIRLPISPLLDIIDVSDPPCSAEHPFGTTSKASLRLSGALIKVGNDESEYSGLVKVDLDDPDADDIENFWQDDWGLKSSVETPWYCLPVCVQHDSYDRGRRNDPEPYKESWKESLKTGFDKFEHCNKVFCLVLQAVAEGQNTYIRVGVCCISRKKGTEISRISFRERQTLTII